jgi:hypothetical protein
LGPSSKTGTERIHHHKQLVPFWISRNPKGAIPPVQPGSKRPTTVAPLPIDNATQVRTILHHLLEHGDIAGRDVAGHTVIRLAVDEWLLERLLTFDPGALRPASSAWASAATPTCAAN